MDGPYGRSSASARSTRGTGWQTTRGTRRSFGCFSLLTNLIIVAALHILLLKITMFEKIPFFEKRKLMVNSKVEHFILCYSFAPAFSSSCTMSV